MKENDFLYSRFRAKGHSKISEFIRETGSQITQESWGKVLKRGGKASVDMMLKMAIELGCTTEEIRGLLNARGETLIAKWIPKPNLSGEDLKFLEKLHALGDDPKKLQLISDMLDSLRRG